MIKDSKALHSQGRSQDFQRGGGWGVDFLLKRAKQGASEVGVAYVRLCVFLELDPPGGFRGKVEGKNPISLDLKAPDCEKIDILNTFSP